MLRSRYNEFYGGFVRRIPAPGLVATRFYLAAELCYLSGIRKSQLVQMAPRLGDVRANLRPPPGIPGKGPRGRRRPRRIPRAQPHRLHPQGPRPGGGRRPGPQPRSSGSSGTPAAGCPWSSGFVEEKPEDERGLFYNSAAFLAEGRILHIHRKVFLPTFGMFEEAKIFAPGRDIRPFRRPLRADGDDDLPRFPPVRFELPPFRRRRRGLHRRLGRARARDVAGAQGFDTSRMWELMGEAVSHFSTAFVLYCNRVGSEDGVTFAGGSFVFGPEGTLLARAARRRRGGPRLRPGLGLVRDVRKRWTFKRDERPEIVLHSLERIVRGDED